MLECILYIFLNGASLLGGNCMPYNGVYYADRVEYVQSYSPTHNTYQHYGTSYPYNHWYYNNGQLYYRTPSYRRYYRYPVRKYKTYRHRYHIRPYKRHRPHARKYKPKRYKPKHHKPKRGKKWRKK